jgi:hypothetical protein
VRTRRTGRKGRHRSAEYTGVDTGPRGFGRTPALVVGAAVALSLVGSGARADSTTGEARNASPVSAPGAASRPLSTAIVDPASFGGDESGIAYDHARRAGARYVKLLVNWADVAPETRPDAFSPRNPADPNYRWTSTDAQVRTAVDAGFTPIVYVQTAPLWAQQCSRGPGPCRPNPDHFADFAAAAARRYNGGYSDLPRVRYWQVWNEPNFSQFLMPQADNARRPVSPEIYRALVNAAYRAIHAVHRDNMVIAGGTMPYGKVHNPVNAVAPLLFMRQLLCLSAGPRPQRVCPQSVRFDIWAHHPYTSGDPQHHAGLQDNVAIPDLWKMRVLLEAARKLGTLRTRGPTRFWVTEIAWDTNPPDPQGVPEKLHARWVAEAMYRMWDQGVSLVTWFLLRDRASGPFQSGLYFRGPDGIGSDAPKAALTAFRFPLVAFREPKTSSVMFWGRSPRSDVAVIVELRTRGKLSVALRLRPNRYGIFSGQFPSTTRVGVVAARLADGSDAAFPFSLVVPPDRPGCVWGTC